MEIKIQIWTALRTSFAEISLEEVGKEPIHRSIAVTSENQKEAVSIAFATVIAKLYESQTHPTKESKT